MPEQTGNQTPNTPDVSESDVRRSTVAELRREAKAAGVTGTSGMRKDDLVEAVVGVRRGGGGAGGDRNGARGSGPDGGHVRTGKGTSRSLKYSQEVTSPDDEPEREGRSLVTTSHDVIQAWAEERSAVPSTVDGTEHGDHLGVLRLDFGGDSERLREVSWEEWFRTFDDRRLNFIYQDTRSDGRQSSFFRLESPDREDA